jgi:hypothetical protein
MKFHDSSCSGIYGNVNSRVLQSEHLCLALMWIPTKITLQRYRSVDP